MIQNLVYLSPHFPPRFHFFAQRLADRGVRVLGVTDRDPGELPPEVRGPLAGHARVSSLHDTEGVVRAVGELRDHFGRIDRVESHLEPWLGLEATLRERFEVPGLRPDRLDRILRKSRMKEVFRDAGVRVARGALLEDEAAAATLVEEAGFPVIVKPDIGVGAQDTHKLDSQQALDALIAERGRAGYLMEEFVPGEIVTYDGLVGGDGKVLFATSLRYSEDARRIATEKLDFHFLNERELPEDLERAGRAAIEALGIPEKFFHLEFFRLASGELSGIEINLRPPGGFATDVFNFAHDIDVYDLWARVLTGAADGFVHDRPYHCAHVCRRDAHAYRHSHDELVALLGPRLCMAERLNPLYAEVMGDTIYLIRSPSEDEIEEMVALVHA